MVLGREDLSRREYGVVEEKDEEEKDILLLERDLRLVLLERWELELKERLD